MVMVISVTRYHKEPAVLFYQIVSFKRGDELSCHIHQEADPHSEEATVEAVTQDSDPIITKDHIDMCIT